METLYIWPGWKIVREIGSGSYGKVYEIQRENGSWTEKAAMKVIRIPSNPIELEQLQLNGMSRESTEEYLAGYVHDIQKEIELMHHFMGCSNIVCYEDHLIRRHVGEIGWDILIRMELLKTLSGIMAARRLTEEEVFQIGMDISQALIICHNDGVIHRDIKPQNIFINDRGVYKLGDFGISRSLPRTGEILSFKGTVPYMAPETFAMRGTDARSDIYSLGLVLYRCLNNGREPFLMTDGFTPRDQEMARMRRLRGEVLPPPLRGSQAIQHVLSIALQADPDKRFQTAEHFRRALWQAANSDRRTIYIDQVAGKTWKTRGVPSIITKTGSVPGKQRSRIHTVGRGKEEFRQRTGLSEKPHSVNRLHFSDRGKVLIACLTMLAVLLFFTSIYLIAGDAGEVLLPADHSHHETATAHDDTVPGESIAKDTGDMDLENRVSGDDDSRSENELPEADAGAGDEPEAENVPAASLDEQVYDEDNIADKEQEDQAADTADIVVFNDPELEKAVRAQLSLADDQPVTKSLAAAQTYLNLSGENKEDREKISDLTGLSAFVNLEELHLSYNRIESLDELKGMDRLKKLKLDFNMVSSLEPLSNLNSLEFLDLEDNKIDDISPITGLTRINLLDVRANQITDIGEIRGMTGLKELLLGRNRIQDISPAADLSNLHTLGFGHNQVEDISALSSLSGLHTLTMGDNQITSIDAVRSMKELQYLDFEKNLVERIDAVEALQELSQLHMKENNIRDYSPLDKLPDQTKVYSDRDES